MPYALRREQVRALLQQEKLSALLVTSAANRFYLSGFELHDPQPNESAGCLLIGQKPEDDWLFTDARYEVEARQIWNPERVCIYAHDAMGTIGKTVLQAGGTVGFEATGLSVAQWEALQKTTTGLGFLAADHLVVGLRRIKDASEIEAMRVSCALNHKLMAHVEQLLPALPENATETSLAWEIEKFFRENGASGLSFSSIVAYNANAAKCHCIPSTSVQIKQNGMVLVDVGCRLNEYCSDQTRTFWLGEKPSARFATAMEQVREAQRLGIAAIRAGVRACDVYAAAYNYFDKLGVADKFTHGLGHGIGLETHESPSLNRRNELVLEPGMVVTVEPGLYYPEWGGIRWEYMALVTEDGCEIF